jgi:hypothetical protein
VGHLLLGQFSLVLKGLPILALSRLLGCSPVYKIAHIMSAFAVPPGTGSGAREPASSTNDSAISHQLTRAKYR